MSKNTNTTKSTKPAAAKTVCPPTFGEYNGKPTITLKRSDDDKYPFTFGASKAALIIQHIDDIRKFAETNAKPS